MILDTKHCGIYAIKNKINGRLYIGQGSNIKRRFNEHLNDLRKNKHNNVHLQSSYTKYGEHNFDLFILEQCTTCCLAEKEQEWIFKYPKSQLYNKVYDVQHRMGDSNPFFGKKHTVETRRKISELSGKLTSEDVNSIVELLKTGNLMHREIAEKFNVSRPTITNIASGKSWTNVTTETVNPIHFNDDGKREFSSSHRKNISASRKGIQFSTETKAKMSEKAKTRSRPKKSDLSYIGGI